jgi:transposase
MDETRDPVLDPGSRKPRPATSGRWRGMTVLGAWVLRQASPSPMLRVAGGIHAERILEGFSGILQFDGYAGYNRLIVPDRIGPDIRFAYCWAHARRKLVDITRNGSAPIADEGVKRIGELYWIEAEPLGY